MYIHISNLNIGINKGKMTMQTVVNEINVKERLNRLTQTDLDRMSEDELQKKYIEYLQKRLLKMDEKIAESVCTCGKKK